MAVIIVLRYFVGVAKSWIAYDILNYWDVSVVIVIIIIISIIILDDDFLWGDWWGDWNLYYVTVNILIVL